MAKDDRGGSLRWSSRGGNRIGGRVGECLVAIFGLGVVLFSPLVMDIFDRGSGATVLGVPLLYGYMLAGWALLIVLIAWAMEIPGGEPRSRRPGDANRPRTSREEREP